MEAKIILPKKLIPVFSRPLGAYRYRCAYGGRGSGKSFNFAKMTAIFGYMQPIRILCAREIQKSLKESVKAEIENAIEKEPFLKDFYEIGESFIRGKNGTEYLFAGLADRRQMDSIKSTADIDLCWIEEAETVSQASWDKLIPTIRAENSEIWATWNPETDGSATDTLFIKKPRKNMIIAKMNYSDNPFFPKVLEDERIEALGGDKYAHIWEGDYLTISDAQIFKKYEVEEFTPKHDWVPFSGLDFGFAQDPTAAVLLWIDDKTNTLYIEYDFSKIGLEIDVTAQAILQVIPKFDQYENTADNARPETISYLKRNGLPKIRPTLKGKGSVEDGVEFIKSFAKIVIHPRCEHTLKEFRLYRYKVDRLTGSILPEIVDENNHIIDSIRYALERRMKNKQVANYAAMVGR